LSCFDDVGRLVMGMTGNELMELKENDNAAVEKAFEEANCKTFTFKCRAKMDSFQDQQRYGNSPFLPWMRANSMERVRYQVQTAAPLNFTAEANKLANLIKLYNID
jgi:replication factor A1